MRPSNTRIVIVDDNTEFLTILSEYLSCMNGFEVVGIAANGLDAIDVIADSKPDVVLLDIMMPHLDGLGVLERIRRLREKNSMQIIMLTAVWNYETTQMALALGADYYMLKPFDFEALVVRIRQLQSIKRQNTACIVRLARESQAESSIESQVKSIIDGIGVPSHLYGYQYLIYASSLVVNDLSLINSMNRNIYSSIAQKFETTPACAERSIRNAVEITWNKGDIERLYKLFGCEINDRKTKPSNSEFIMTVVNQYWNRHSSDSFADGSFPQKGT
jgi:two-component system response regulator (stage 0 sporulation protein A)